MRTVNVKTNPAGLTFEEWVCAAGLAVFDHQAGTARPYSVSHTTYRSVALPRPPHLPAVVVLCSGTSRPPPGSVKKVRNTRVFYPRRVRAAWLAGEDPTEYRASPDSTTSLLGRRAGNGAEHR